MNEPSQGPTNIWKRLLGRDVKKSAVQLIKFNIIGIINVAVTYSLFSLLVFIGVHYIIALIVEYAVGITNSFIFNKRITFKNTQKTSFIMISKMLIAYMISFFLSMGLLILFIDTAGMNKYLARLITIAIVGGFSFLMQKFFVFSDINKG